MYFKKKVHDFNEISKVNLMNFQMDLKLILCYIFL